jgi:hypothetical protein
VFLWPLSTIFASARGVEYLRYSFNSPHVPTPDERTAIAAVAGFTAGAASDTARGSLARSCRRRQYEAEPSAAVDGRIVRSDIISLLRIAYVFRASSARSRRSIEMRPGHGVSHTQHSLPPCSICLRLMMAAHPFRVNPGVCTGLATIRCCPTEIGTGSQSEGTRRMARLRATCDRPRRVGLGAVANDHRP